MYGSTGRSHDGQWFTLAALIHAASHSSPQAGHQLYRRPAPSLHAAFCDMTSPPARVCSGSTAWALHRVTVTPRRVPDQASSCQDDGRPWQSATAMSHTPHAAYH